MSVHTFQNSLVPTTVNTQAPCTVSKQHTKRLVAQDLSGANRSLAVTALSVIFREKTWVPNVESGPGLRGKCTPTYCPGLVGLLALSVTETAAPQHTAPSQSEWTFIRKSPCKHTEKRCAVGSTHFLRKEGHSIRAARGQSW